MLLACCYSGFYSAYLSSQLLREGGLEWSQELQGECLQIVHHPETSKHYGPRRRQIIFLN